MYWGKYCALIAPSESRWPTYNSSVVAAAGTAHKPSALQNSMKRRNLEP
jgi:hypothetical protein